jgi:hypothetical protein
MVTLAQWIQGLSVPGSDYAEETTMLGRKFPVGSAVVLIEAFVVPDSTQGGAAESQLVAGTTRVLVPLLQGVGRDDAVGDVIFLY